MASEKIGLLQRSIDALKSSIDIFSGKQQKLRKELQQAEQTIRENLQSVTQTRAELDEFEVKLSTLEQDQQRLEKNRDDQQAAIAEALKDAYKHGKQNRLKLILNQQDPAEVDRLLKYYDYLGKARQKKIAAYMRTLSGIEISKVAQQKARDDIKGRAEILQQQHRTLEQAQDQRQLALASLNKEIGTATEQLSEQEQERDQLKELMVEIERQLADINLPYQAEDDPFKDRKGKLAWPVEGKVANKYGSLKPNSRLRWQGLKISAKEGDDVRAIHSGRVVFADWFSSQGLMVLVDHGDRYMSLYAHNSSILKKTGQLVRANEVIATVGNSGGQSYSGVYFEIRSKGEPVNPVAWCR